MIAFTICSNNYLAEAISLGNSLIKNGLSPSNFQIFLVDKYDLKIEYEKIQFKIVEVNQNLVPEFDRIKTYYNIIELNTAVKPSVFKFLISTFSNETLFTYFDPDIFIYRNVEKEIESALKNKDILLTPHITKPVPLEKEPFENVFLNYGLYNLGFLAVKRGISTNQMLDWWELRTIKHGIDDPSKGLFVDQLWMNLVPIFFSNVEISNHLGFNAAYWNINERIIEKKNDETIINQVYPLIFFHFSSFDISLEKLSKRTYSEPTWDLSALREMMAEYKEELYRNSYDFYKSLTPAYKITLQNFLDRNLPNDSKSKKITLLIKIQRIIPKYLFKKIANLNHIIETIRKH